MKLQTIALCLLLAATGCGPRRAQPVTPETRLRTATGEVDVDRLRRWSKEAMPEASFDMWMAAVGTLDATNRDAALLHYAMLADSNIVEVLASYPPSRLDAMRGSLVRGTARHPYTREQLDAAQALKQSRSKPRRTIEN